MRIALLTALLLTAACTADARVPTTAAERDAADAAKLAKALDGLTPGAPQTCIQQGRVDYDTQAIGKTILYKVSRKLIYRSDTAGGCERAAYGDALVSRNSGAGLCSGQIIETVDFGSRFTSGSCSLGPFVPYRPK